MERHLLISDRVFSRYPKTPVMTNVNEAQALDRFLGDTENHVMTVLHDEGVYRHVRFKAPGTVMYYYDLVTWPGHLVICGDAGDLHFARIEDMFDFFTGPGINPGYWCQKIQSRDDPSLRYSPALYEERVKQWRDEYLEEMTPEEGAYFFQAVQQDLLAPGWDDEHWARKALNEFTYPGGIYPHDVWDWELRDFDPRFLWLCWAILKGVERYKESVRVAR